MMTTLTAIPSHPARTVDTLSAIEILDDGSIELTFDQTAKRRGRAAGPSIVTISAEHAAQIAQALPRGRARRAQ